MTCFASVGRISMIQVSREEANLLLAKAICHQWIVDKKPESEGQGRLVRWYAEQIARATTREVPVYSTARLKNGRGAYIDRL